MINNVGKPLLSIKKNLSTKIGAASVFLDTGLGYEHAIRRPLCVFLRARGYEVLDFPSPMTSTLLTEQKCVCSRERACADLVINDMKMLGMTGLE